MRFVEQIHRYSRLILTPETCLTHNRRGRITNQIRRFRDGVMTKPTFYHVLLPVLAIAISATLSAQTSTTSAVTGTVFDPQGAAVAGARITARNAATGT